MQTLIFVCIRKFESLRIFDHIYIHICLQICMHICKPTSYIYVLHLEGDKIHSCTKWLTILDCVLIRGFKMWSYIMIGRVQVPEAFLLMRIDHKVGRFKLRKIEILAWTFRPKFWLVFFQARIPGQNLAWGQKFRLADEWTLKNERD